MKVIINCTCEEYCMGSIQHNVHQGYFWAIWLKETHISVIKKTLKTGQI